MSNQDEFDYVDIPEIWKGSKAIEREDGTRWYVERGPRQHFWHWLRELHEAQPGNLIPMQWVPDVVGVTRAAVRKRAISGQLTVFTFILANIEKSRLGKYEYKDTRVRHDYMALSEVDAWRDLIWERMSEEAREEENKQTRERRSLFPKMRFWK